MNVSKFIGCTVQDIIDYMRKHGSKELESYVWSCKSSKCKDGGKVGVVIWEALTLFESNRNRLAWEDYPHGESTWSARQEVVNFCRRNSLTHDMPHTLLPATKITVKCGCGWHKTGGMAEFQGDFPGCMACKEQNTRRNLMNRVLSVISEEKLKYEFVGWSSKVVGDNLYERKMMLSCEVHGEFYPTPKNFLNLGSRCPSCNPCGFSPALPSVFYLLSANKGSKGFAGFGITRNFKNRLGQHKCSLKKEGFEVKDYKSWEMSGQKAWEIEKEILRIFPIFPQKISGFKREATYLRHYKEVVKLVDKMLLDENKC